MYNLKTYAGRLRALSDKHSLLIHTEFNGGVFVNLHSLEEHLWAVKRTDFPCTMRVRKAVTAREFDDGCNSVGLEGVVRDELREALFGSVAGAQDQEFTCVSYDLSGLVGRFVKLCETPDVPTKTEDSEATEAVKAYAAYGKLVLDTDLINAAKYSQPIFNPDCPGPFFANERGKPC